MRIAYYVHHYPKQEPVEGYFWGGVGESARGLAEEMALLGHTVTVFTSASSYIRSIRQQNGVEVIECPSIAKVSESYIAPSLLWSGLDHRVDIVHAHVGVPPAPFGALIHSRLSHAPLVATCHGEHGSESGGFIRRVLVTAYRDAPLRYLFERADLLFVPSRQFADTSPLLGGLTVPQCELPNGIELQPRPTLEAHDAARSRLGLPKDVFALAYLGSLTPPKGVALLLDALEILHRRGESVLALIVGSGSSHEWLRSIAERAGILGEVRFVGFAGYGLKFEYLRAADLLVQPSEREAFGMAILEGFSVGTPAVVSDLPALRALVKHGENGLVFRPGDVNALADALSSLISDRNSLKRLAEKAYVSSRVYGWDRIGRKAEENYRSLLAEHERCPARCVHLS